MLRDCTRTQPAETSESVGWQNFGQILRCDVRGRGPRRRVAGHGRGERVQRVQLRARAVKQHYWRNSKSRANGSLAGRPGSVGVGFLDFPKFLPLVLHFGKIPKIFGQNLEKNQQNSSNICEMFW